MKIHHLNCCTMCPRMVGVDRLVCHCLLIETDDGLVLVDTGLGADDLAQRHQRLGRVFVSLSRPRFSAEELATARIRELGFSPEDVRHIVLTHLDLDHAGALADFPAAKVHLMGAEHRSATAGPTRKERVRYLRRQWAHGANWRTYEPGAGEPWFGFEAVRELDGLPPEILLVPLFGHSYGHCAIAVDRGDKWLLHCGDAYFFHGEMQTPPTCTLGFRLFQKTVAFDGLQRVENQRRLRGLVREQSDRVDVFCAHDEIEFLALAGGSTNR